MEDEVRLARLLPTGYGDRCEWMGLTWKGSIHGGIKVLDLELHAARSASFS